VDNGRVKRLHLATLSVLLLAGCNNTRPAIDAAPDDTTPPGWVVESTAPPQDLVGPVTVPGALNEDAVGVLIHSYLPDHVGEAGSGGDVFCAYELFGWERQTDTAEAWLWTYCQEFNMEAPEGTGISTPATIHFSELPAGWVVSFAEQAGMGSDYADSVREMFPSEIAKRALEDGPSLDLASIVELAARNTLGG
jgi:hypothetical protein